MTTPAAKPGEPALAAARLAKTFRAGPRTVEALRDVSLQARAGAVTGLIGPDGAGKTTLMRLAAGLLEPDSGQVRVLGMDATEQSLAVQASVGYMPQRFGLYEDLSVRDNLGLYADLQGVPGDRRAGRFGELMHMTGLGPFETRLAGRLSGGMKQKLGLACTLLSRPRLLLLDEPTVGVDPVSRRELWTIVYRLVDEQGMGVLLSTAYLDEAERCHDVVLLHEGAVLGSGPPAQLSEPLAGRAFLLRAAGMKARTAQAAVARAPGVLDTVVQGDGVRLLLAEGARPSAQDLLPRARGVRMEAVAPRFEDGFIAMLKDLEGPQAPAKAPPAGTGLAAGSAGPVIEVRGLSRRFGSFYAVRDIGFEVYRGEVLGLLGANGAGKTTTFRMLCGLLPPSGGELSVAGLDLRHAAAAARGRIGYMSQRFSLYGNLTVAENLAFFSSSYGLRGRERSRRVEWALGEFDLARVRGASSLDLPLGYKQRLALACALMHGPDILFLDEPTSGVDPLARREFWLRINALADGGVTVLVTTHFMEEAEYCDRLAIMAAGEILALDTPAAVKARARRAGRPAPSMEDAFITLIEGHRPRREDS
ncbi:MAG: ABC transporter ATP-binding protein [Gammaproteobacteria bacterium]|nr:ABC transporter ATP-binding protein [Gammaproteobacteria bacterium]NIR97103.1 ABC transporter ATP-binding protein [Gammaproteobacteria bacterium]NIT62806.1 ABC transporter ATP-binding protein [Gammaproteobacteria bacterium]NIV19771.1 ATP-binding cassette domain-containing protein [Gammaproteobacteria bacterium]NIX11215.1 ATP-binding cassette domain-containing protein [Gammaproteobacteria bacterium]